MNIYFEVYSITNDLGNMFSILTYASSVSLKLVCSVVEIEQLHL